MAPPKPLVNRRFLLQKYPGKGGWIYAAKTEATKAKRILQMMERLALGLRLHDKT